MTSTETSKVLSDFPASEYETRLARIQAAMAGAGLEALIISSESNHRYATGHWTGRWYNLSRPIFSVVPAQGKPTLLTSKNEATMASMTSWSDDIRAYWSDDHRASGALEDLIELLREKKLSHGRLGFELGVAHRLGTTQNDFARLAASLPEAEFVDAADLWWTVRATKSASELVPMRDACAITDQVFDELSDVLKPGMIERDVARWMSRRYYELGADRPGFIMVRANTKDAVAGAAGYKPLELGGMIYIDAGCVVRGYWSDYCRYYALGTVESAALDAHRAQWELVQRCLEAVIPGRVWGDVFAAQQAGIRELKLPDAGFFGRCGHGIGLDQCEHPSLNATNSQLIEPGMTFCIEPNFQSESSGYFVGEEEVVVTATGHELLNKPASREPYTIK